MAAVVFSSFIAGAAGLWKIVAHRAVAGEPLADAERLSVEAGLAAPASPAASAWTLRGAAGHVRYVVSDEKVALGRVQPPLGREQATLAAFIPIRKSAAWWELAQDERRAILEDRSRHIADGMRYLPAIARRLYQSRELGEPFDFLTWFEYAPEHAGQFEELTQLLRSTEEWRYVEREVDIRLER
jgi:chlorite dismutase